MGVYGNVDSALEQAQIIQEDLLREEQYGGNNYELGSIDNSILGLLSVAPVAIITALFRPFYGKLEAQPWFFLPLKILFYLLLHF